MARGEINVHVNLCIDDRTAQEMLNLLAIYCTQKDKKIIQKTWYDREELRQVLFFDDLRKEDFC